MKQTVTRPGRLTLARGDLREALAAHAARATAEGRRPVAMAAGDHHSWGWCPAMKALRKNLDDDRLRRALAGVDLLVVDVLTHDPEVAGLRAEFPAFRPLEPDGSPGEDYMTGGAWGADTADNMARVLGRFFGNRRGDGPAPALEIDPAVFGEQEEAAYDAEEAAYDAEEAAYDAEEAAYDAEEAAYDAEEEAARWREVKVRVAGLVVLLALAIIAGALAR